MPLVLRGWKEAFSRKQVFRKKEVLEGGSEVIAVFEVIDKYPTSQKLKDLSNLLRVFNSLSKFRLSKTKYMELIVKSFCFLSLSCSQVSITVA